MIAFAFELLHYKNITSTTSNRSCEIINLDENYTLAILHIVNDLTYVINHVTITITLLYGYIVTGKLVMLTAAKHLVHSKSNEGSIVNKVDDLIVITMTFGMSTN